MNEHLIIKFDKELLVFITVVYYTSKLLWDNIIPYAFTFGYIAICGWYLCKYIVQIKKNKIKLIGYFFFFSLYIVLDAAFQDDNSQLIRAIYEYIIYPLPFFLIMVCLPYIDIKAISYKIVRFGGVIAVLSWYEYFTKSHLLNIHSGNTGILYGGSYAFRAAVFARSDLAQGVILGFFTIVAFYNYLQNKLLSNFLIMLFLLVSIFTTSSRGPLVSTVVGIFVMYLLNMIYIERSSLKKVVSFVIAVICCLGILFLLTSNIQTGNEMLDYFLLRTRNIINWESDAGNVGRISRWKWAINLYKSSPIFGIGPSKTGSWGNASIGVTESGVLKRLCELGIVGFIMHYTFVACISFSSICLLKKTDSDIRLNMLLFLGLFMLVFCNDFIVQSTEEPSVCFIMWFALAGMLYLLDELEK